MDTRWLVAFTAAMLGGMAGWRSIRTGKPFKEELLRLAATVSLWAFVSLALALEIQRLGEHPESKGNVMLTGFVTDAAGAGIEHAAVRLIEIESGVEHFAQTNGRGEFFFRGLLPGMYELTIAAAGFEPAVKEVLTLVHDDDLALRLQPNGRSLGRAGEGQNTVAW